MTKCQTCKHLSSNRRLQDVCLECVLTPNFSKYEKRDKTNFEKLTSGDKETVKSTLLNLIYQIQIYKPQSPELYMHNWLDRNDL